jgi:hypothetical protein
MSAIIRIRTQSYAWLREQERLIGFAVFIGALLLFSLYWPYSLSNWFYNLKGGVSTVGAERVLSGDIPYRDFWTMYAPGHFYLLALLFLVFGNHLLVEVIVASIISASAAYICYRIVVGIVNQRFLGIASAAVFTGSMYTTGYFKRLGSYPPAIFLILLALFLMILYYQNQKIKFLVLSGLSVGLSIVIKHDIGIYSVIAILFGLFVHQISASDINFRNLQIRKFVFYLGSTAIPVIPIFIVFAALAGRQMLEDLLIFPMTDFRFARPQVYPGILPVGVFSKSPLTFVENLTRYINFTTPYFLFLLGVSAIGMAIISRSHKKIVLGVTFVVAYLFHFGAAHVQVNTHIVSMSVYSTFMAALFYEDILRTVSLKHRRKTFLIALFVILVWVLSLLGNPIYRAWNDLRISNFKIDIEKVAGINVTQEEYQGLTGLVNYVKSQVSPDQKIFVGLRRHDVIVINDVMIYYLLDRPIATKYHELHPAIADTEMGQSEIISELLEDEVSLIVLKYLFPESVLEWVKLNRLQNLPQTGATNLDEFIKENYENTRTFGPYEVWEQIDRVSQ